MKRFKLVALLLAITTVLAACDQNMGNADRGAPAPANGAVGESSTPAPAQPATSFALLERPDTGEAIAAPCAIDKVNAASAATQTITVENGREARFSGWVSDPQKQVPSQFTIVLTGPATYGAAGTAGSSRPDVARVLKSEALGNAGFNVLAKLDAVEPGEYALSIEQNASGQVVRCTMSTRILVVKSPV